MSRRFARFIEWELTARCDLECVHCYVRRGARAGRELDRDEVDAMASRLVGLGCRSVTLSGGEPLLRRGWPRIAAALSHAGARVQMVSNGQRLGRDEARAAGDSGVGMVMLSLDGLERAHDRIRRRRGAFGRVLAAAGALREAGVPFGFLTTILSWNAGELERMEPLVSGLGPALWQVWLAIPRGGAGPWPSRGQARALPARLEELARRCPVVAAGDNVPSPLRRTAGRRFECGAGRIVMGLRSDGGVKGCLALPGAGTQGPPEEAWSRCAPAGRSASCRATVRTPGRVRRHAAAVAASAAVVTSLAAGCGHQPAPVQEPEAPPVEVQEETREADREPAPPPEPAAGLSLLDAQCTCVSDAKNPDGTPVSTSPCMCVSHMMCTATTGMWLCPEGHTQQVAPPATED